MNLINDDEIKNKTDISNADENKSSDAEKFSYTYSSAQREEIEEIRSRYIFHNDSDMDKLRKLDAKVSSAATAAGIITGVAGTLVFGTGLSLCLSFDNYIFGIPTGIIGFAGIALALPVHNLVMKKQKQKYGKEIIRLSEKLLNEG